MDSYRKALRLGYSTEYRVLVALKAIMKQGKIERYKVVKRNSRDDRRGIDFWILIRGRWVPLQVKSSEFFQAQHYLKHPTIPCIVGTGNNLIPRIKRAVRAYLAGDYDART